MQYTSSQEQTIYRSLAGQLQLGFFFKMGKGFLPFRISLPIIKFLIVLHRER